MPNRLACTLGSGVESVDKVFGSKRGYELDQLYGKYNSRRCFEEHSDATYPWGLEFTEHGSDEYFRLHCTTGRLSAQRRRFLQYAKHWILVVLLLFFRVRGLDALPVCQLQRFGPQPLQPEERLLGSLLEGLGRRGI